MKVALTGIALGICAALFIGNVRARDLGQWEGGDQAVREWYRSLKQPNSEISCCGEADAYWADEVHVRDGEVYATITDNRADGPLRRPHIPIGTVIHVPKDRLVWRDGNPTGHVVIFIGWLNGEPSNVLCFVQGGGV